MPDHYGRILIVDDTPGIHADFQKVLAVAPRETPADLAIFGDAEPAAPRPFRLADATQGEEAIEMLRAAIAASDPFAIAFVDVRMPPGLDGIVTARRLWELDPDLQVVICSAYSDYSWSQMSAELGTADRWVILKKPFDPVEVLQLAHSLMEKWRLRREMQEHLTRLEAMVAARTADLATALEKLRAEVAEREQAQRARRDIERKLEEAQRLESLGVLAGGVAHDFNNILTGILMSASLAALDAPGGSELQRRLQVIEENSRRAASLCEQLLTYAGRSRVRASVIDLNCLVRETLDLLQISIPKDAELSVALAEVSLPLSGDPSRLRQVFMNLVLNAAEALDDPPRRIMLTSGRVRLSAADLNRFMHVGNAQPGEFCFFEVSDTGVGMAPETLHRIFEPFFTTKFTGRGLGLSAVLGIIRAHHGALDVASTVGSGTVFRSYFPIAAEGIQPAAADHVPGLARLTGRILVVDDEECVRSAIVTILERLGAEVIAAADGEEAIAAVARLPEPLTGALIDITMPKIDGITTMQALRQRQPDLPVVLMTGRDAQAIAAKLADGQRVACLQKPFSLDDLIQVATREFTERLPTTVRGAEPAGTR